MMFKLSCALMVLLLACGEPDLRNPKTLDHILAGAVDIKVLQERDVEDVFYVPNESEAYTGWAKWMYRDDTQVFSLEYYERGDLRRQIKWYDNGQIEAEGYYEKGKKAGRWVTWHSNGQMETEGYYAKGELTGQWIGWYDNGQIEYEILFEHSKGIGRWVTWHDKDQMASEIHFNNCSEIPVFSESHLPYSSGECKWVSQITWHENGQKESEKYYVKGQIDQWIETEWYDNGQKASEGYYVEGKRTGCWVLWHDNGQMKHEMHFENNEMTKPIISWHENGQKASEFYFKNCGVVIGQGSIQYYQSFGSGCELEGHSVKWYENGQKASEGYYENNERTGQWIEWDESGQITSKNLHP